MSERNSQFYEPTFPLRGSPLKTLLSREFKVSPNSSSNHHPSKKTKNALVKSVIKHTYVDFIIIDLKGIGY